MFKSLIVCLLFIILPQCSPLVSRVSILNWGPTWNQPRSALLPWLPPKEIVWARPSRKPNTIFMLPCLVVTSSHQSHYTLPQLCSVSDVFLRVYLPASSPCIPLPVVAHATESALRRHRAIPKCPFTVHSQCSLNKYLYHDYYYWWILLSIVDDAYVRSNTAEMNLNLFASFRRPPSVLFLRRNKYSTSRVRSTDPPTHRRKRKKRTVGSLYRVPSPSHSCLFPCHITYTNFSLETDYE